VSKSSTGPTAVIEPVIGHEAVTLTATKTGTVIVRPRRPRGRPRIEGPERVFGHPLRLRIAKALAGTPILSFVYLRNLLGTNDGTLAAHARKLENAGYVACDKTFAGRMPRTEFRLSDEGRNALEGYLSRQLPRR
jgi:DNA-binding transcriptional ArsR family regulator